MNDRICDVIARLKVDSDGLAFTGFIANAHVTHPSVLEGEIWHHVHAETAGKFVDGHRIQTPGIIEIHVRGKSISRSSVHKFSLSQLIEMSICMP
ncbi:hypothetical protein [Pseudomonas izuensis]|uniref:hypothetical protein n=1 Tax=Pseudomonas izuensis TaxID=2684212 RepID=UPI001356D131|nr:hypothetical protein [Pseudomonas izuensis]